MEIDDPEIGGETITAPISVLLVEDHQLLAEALQSGLGGGELRVMGIATSRHHAHELLRTRSFDVALVDLQLPDGDGLDVARHIHEHHPRTRVVICSARSDRHVVTKALQMGCSGFISKEESFQNVAGALRAAASGAVSLSPRIAEMLTRAPARGASKELLTDREQEVVELMSRGLSTEQIAEELCVSRNTMRNYYAKLNEKLGAHSKLEVVMRALELGLVSRQADSDEHVGSSA